MYCNSIPDSFGNKVKSIRPRMNYAVTSDQSLLQSISWETDAALKSLDQSLSASVSELLWTYCVYAIAHLERTKTVIHQDSNLKECANMCCKRLTAYVLVILSRSGKWSNAYALVQMGYLGRDILVNRRAVRSTRSSQMYTWASPAPTGRPCHTRQSRKTRRSTYIFILTLPW